MIGEVFGSFRITERLAGGGMGVVYRAVHAMTGEQVAMKHLLPQFAGNPEMISRFLQEARTAATIDDPGIVRVLDAGLVPAGGAYLVMELLAGETLTARLAREGPLAAAVAVPILRQVCRTVAAAHRARVVHRDLKPDNIFLVPDPDIAVGVRAKVLDFGIAKLLGDEPGVHTQTGCAMGTPGYMAPELWANAKDSDGRTDVYALGCIAYEMLAGAPAFPGPSLAAFLDQHRNEPPPPLTAKQPALAGFEPVIARALAKAPADRWPTAEALSAALSSVVDNGDRANRVAPSPSAPRPNPAKLVMFGGAAIGVAAIVASAALRKRGGDQPAPAGAPHPEICDRVVTVARRVPSVLPVRHAARIRELAVTAVTFGSRLSDEAAAVDEQTYFGVYHESVASAEAIARWQGQMRYNALAATQRDWEIDSHRMIGDDHGRKREVVIADTFTASGPTPSVLLKWSYVNEGERPDGERDTTTWIATRVPPGEAAATAIQIDRLFADGASPTSSFVDPSCRQAAGEPAATTGNRFELRSGASQLAVGDDGTLAVQLAAAPELPIQITGTWAGRRVSDAVVQLVMRTPELAIEISLTAGASARVAARFTSTAQAHGRFVQKVTLPRPPAGWYLGCAAAGERTSIKLARSPDQTPCPRDLELAVDLAPGESGTREIEIAL